MTTDRPVLGSLVIANYITATTDLEISTHRDKGHSLLFANNKMPMLPPKETMLMTARIL